jgi:hypothetical protein
MAQTFRGLSSFTICTTPSPSNIKILFKKQDLKLPQCHAEKKKSTHRYKFFNFHYFIPNLGVVHINISPTYYTSILLV